VPPGEGLSALGAEEALALRETLAHEPISLGVATPLARTQETLALALGARDVPRIVVPGFGEIGFGAFEGGMLADYRAWAWTTEAE
jgi:broad specificity phosphatase PhoE